MAEQWSDYLINNNHDQQKPIPQARRGCIRIDRP
jgi:hypothetical protein